MMLRDYSTGYKDDVQVFSGLEVEHTPAYGKQTLFLARNDLTFDQIQELAVMADAEAIYYGANRTYMHKSCNCTNTSITDRGYYCWLSNELHRLVAKNLARVGEKIDLFVLIIFPHRRR